MQARQRAGTLEEQVVDPSNTTRIRLLGGRIPEKEELVAKLQVSVPGSLPHRVAAAAAVVQQCMVVWPPQR
jgi:hypothetical protein